MTRFKGHPGRIPPKTKARVATKNSPLATQHHIQRRMARPGANVPQIAPPGRVQCRHATATFAVAVHGLFRQASLAYARSVQDWRGNAGLARIGEPTL
jgi:hypothetical protein